MLRPPHLCLAACLLQALAAPRCAAEAEIVLGMSAAFKGPSAGLGTELYRGARAWFDEVNRRGGVHGRTVRLIAYDDGYDPGPAVVNTRRLIVKDNVFLLFGYVGTPTTARVLPLLARYRDRSIYLFCPFTGAEPLRSGPFADRVFNLRPSYREETARLVDQFVAIGRPRIAVFYQIDAYGRSGWDGVRRALKKHKLKMVAEATYRRGATFSERMHRQVDLLRAGSPDAIICVGAYAACAAFIRDARDAGLDVPIANLSFVGSENLMTLLRRHGRGQHRDYTTGLINSQVVPSYTREDLPAIGMYRKMMEKHRPTLPPDLVDRDYQPLPHSFTGLEGFLSARLVVEVLKKMGREPRRDRLVEAAESLGEVDLGLARPAKLTRQRHQALDRVYFTVVDKGQLVPLSEADWKRWRK